MNDTILTMARAATIALVLGSGFVASPAFSQATDAEGYGDGYQSGAYGRIRSAEGGATIVRADSETEEPGRADVNAPLFPGDKLRTGRDQRVEVQLAGGTIVRIDRGSEVVFQSLPSPGAKFQDNSVLALQAGIIRVVPHLVENEEFRVDTEDASVYVLGDGDFRIEADGRGATRVASMRGVAEVAANGASVLVRGGMRTVASAGSAPDEPTAASAFAADGFDRWCDARDDVYRAHDPETKPAEVTREEVPEEVQPYYSELSHQGTWEDTPDYGAVWSPTGMASDWRPYSDGYWDYGPSGYFWVSAEPWGWAPYHYGNWQWLHHRGWCWVPGHVFAGAWVSWSWGSLYVGWSPLDTWGRPAWIGAPLYGGYYDPGCWTFVGYNHFHAGNVHRYAVPFSSVREDISHTTVVARAPRVDPKRVAESPEWRARALQQVSDDRAARMRPIQGSRLPDRRLSDIQNHLMKRPVAAPVAHRIDDATAGPSIERRTTAPSRSRQYYEDPRGGNAVIRRDVRPETEDGVRDLYQRMSRPHETRRQDVAPTSRDVPSYLPRQPWRVAPEVARPAPPRAEPRVELPRMQQPRPAPQAPRVEMPRQQRPQPQAQAPHGHAPPKHGEKH